VERIERAFFLWAFLRARLYEIYGNLQRAASIIELASPPPRYLALHETYRARLVALEYGPQAGLMAISRLKSAHWYLAPQNQAELYAQIYCEYLQYALEGKATERIQKRNQLRSIDAPRLYRSSLLVT
jgi:hypothetical protein